jgi:hypothetical protein
LKDAGLDEGEMFSEVPIKTAGIHNTICNDLMKLKRALPDLFKEVDIDLVAYFLVCRDEIQHWLEPGHPSYLEKITAWQEALAQQKGSVQREVSAKVRATEAPVGLHKKIWRLGYNSSLGTTSRKLMNEFQQRRELPPRPKRFSNILDAVNWIEMSEARRS